MSGAKKKLEKAQHLAESLKLYDIMVTYRVAAESAEDAHRMVSGNVNGVFGPAIDWVHLVQMTGGAVYVGTVERARMLNERDKRPPDPMTWDYYRKVATDRWPNDEWDES